MLKNIHLFWLFLSLIIACYFFHFNIYSSALIALLIITSLVAFWIFNIKYSLFIKSICKIKTNEKIVFLTFDDGPSEDYTPIILDTLKEYNTEATFFCIGQNIQKNKELFKRIHTEGHVIGNHTYSHNVKFTYSSEEKVTLEITKCSNIIADITGEMPKLFRPPYGVTNPTIAITIQKLAMKSVGWTIRSFDTKAKDEHKLLMRITNCLHPGAIILLHDNLKITSDILPQLIENINKKGYKIVSLKNYI